MALTKVTYSMIQGAVINVLDYSATNNGVTDDRTAINLAFAACIANGGGTVYFPEGTYFVTDFVGNTDYAGVTQNISIAVEAEVGFGNMLLTEIVLLFSVKLAS
jgi:hypothetical protein